MKQVIDFFTGHNLPLTNKKLVVATSGGPDSMALLDMLLLLKKKYQLQLVAAHFDHQLRSDSFEEARLIKKYCLAHNIIFVNQKWQHNEPIDSGLEAAARKARYAFLLTTMRQQHGDYLLTAHHNDDLLENILLKFIRSGNPSEMNSLQAAGQMQGLLLLRPLLSWSKDELLAYDQKHGIPFIIDQTNLDDDTQRNRLRHHIVPLLKKENPNLGMNALNFSKNISLLTGLTAEKFADVGQPKLFLNVAYRLPQAALADFTANQQQLYWQYFIWRTWHLRVNEHLGGFTLSLYQNYFYLSKNNLPLPQEPAKITLDKPFTFINAQFVVTNIRQHNLLYIGSFYAEKQMNFMAGTLRPGIKLQLKNGQHVKSKKKFAQHAIPERLRPFCLTIYAAGQAVFVQKTYQQQTYSQQYCAYYVYQLNNKKC